MRSELAPTRRHHESDEENSEAHEDVALAELRNRENRAAHVEDYDPQQAEQHETEHDRLEPHRVRRVITPAGGGRAIVRGTRRLGCRLRGRIGLGAFIRAGHAENTTADAAEPAGLGWRV